MVFAIFFPEPSASGGTSGDDNSVDFIAEYDEAEVRNGGAAGPSASLSQPREITFNVHHNYEVHQIKISNHVTLGKYRSDIVRTINFFLLRAAAQRCIVTNRNSLCLATHTRTHTQPI